MRFSERLKAAREELSAKLGKGKVTQGKFANMCGWRNAQGRIANYESGFREPSIDDLKAMRSMLANHGIMLPIDGLEAAANTSPDERPTRRVPLISWVAAGSWAGIVDNFHPGDAEQWWPTSKAVGPNAFALRVRGDSMEPRFPDGCIIIVDPDKKADNGSLVVVRLDDEDEATFKKLVKDGSRRYLKPLNPQYPAMPIEGDATICGVVRYKFIEEDCD